MQPSRLTPKGTPRAPLAFDVGGLLVIGLAAYGVTRLGHEWRAPQGSGFEIDLRLSALPLYTFFSLCRGLAAFALSFVFTLVYGYTAARVRNADKVLLPLLDVLQSIPVLGFMPGLVLALASLFPRSNVGLELAAILMIFTGQVWNLTFAFHASLRAIPNELLEAGRIYRFSWWRRFRRIELPFSTVGLIWNGMMSMAGGWFFLTINEAFRLGDRDFRLPGVGAYMSVAIDRGDTKAMVGAVVAMIAMIVLLDQLLWRPLVAWSEKFKFQDIGGEPATSWLLDLLRRSRLRTALREQHFVSLPALPKMEAPRRAYGTALLWVALAVAAAICVQATLKLVVLLAQLPAHSWHVLLHASALTLLRTTAAVALGTLWAVPAGIYIGTHPKASRLLQPLVQIAASFPAPMLFPLVLAALASARIGLGWGSIVLMALGTQWYVLFNVIAGAMSIPAELQEAARMYRFTRAQVWRRVLLPGVFPSLVTGWITAAGGAWNASIVSEYVHSKGDLVVTDGLGAAISRAAENAQFAELAAGVLLMAVLVVALNRLLWQRLSRLAERRYSL